MWRVFEVLTSPFSSTKEIDDTSIQTEEEKIDLELTTDFELPSPRTAKYTHEEKTYKYDKAQRESSKIKQYRSITVVPEVSSAIDEIVNEAITKGLEETIKPELVFDEKSTVGKSTQKAYTEAWDEILNIIDFESNGYDLFYKWYVDSKLVGECIYKKDNVGLGIQHVSIISPLNFAKGKEEDGKEFYSYLDDNFKSFFKDNENKYDIEQVALATSGLKSTDYSHDIGYLELALKSVNNMRSIEDSLVIYRYLRGGDKRIWNVPVGKLAKSKAETYIKKVMNNIRFNKQYNRDTGEIVNSTSIESIVDDWVFPTKGSEKVEVETLSGDTSFLTDLNDHDLFLKKLYIGMKIPTNRLDDASTLDFSGEDVIKQELKFIKHIKKLRNKFQVFLLDILKKHLIAMNKITIEEWIEARKSMKVVWNDDNNILKKVVMNGLVEKAEAFSALEDSNILGVWMSKSEAFKTIFNITGDELDENLKKILDDEKKFDDEDDDEDEKGDEDKDSKDKDDK